MPEGSPEARGGGARPSGPGRAGDGLVALALALPAALPYVAHVLRAAQGALLPTGFLVYDMAFYMANAREHFDGGGFRLLYGLPFSPAYTTPAIYFQPHTLLLGAVWRATGLDVGAVFVLVGAAAAWACARVAVALAGALVVSQTRKLGYLATVYTPLRSWYAHHTGTPDSEARAEELRRFFAMGEVPAAWQGRRLLVVLVREGPAAPRPSWGGGRNAAPVFANAGFAVFRLEPARSRV